jgi:pyruvate dehydrogenase E2 component (dihydrolipoamide acetyltransferase)
VLRLTLSIDHRVVDGATGAAFLARLKDVLEQPLRIVA